MPHTATRCCCNKQQHKTPRAQQHTSLLVPCAHGKLNVKHYRTTPKPETHITRHVVEKEAALYRKIRNRAPKKRVQAAQPPPHPPHDSKQYNYWVELVRVCRLAVVAAAAACCSYCNNENPPPPNEARAIRRAGRRAIFFPPSWHAGWYVHVSHVPFGLVDGAFLRVITPLTPTNRVDFNTFDNSGHDCSNHPIFTARLSL